MDEATTNSFRAAQARAKALRSTGTHDDNYIVDSVMALPNLSQKAKDILKQAKVQGISTKAVDDILSLPVETKVDVGPVTSEDVRGTLKKTLGNTIGGSIANASEFLGIDKAGRALGSTLGSGDVAQLAKEGKISEQDLNKFRLGGSTGAEVAGSAALTAGSILAPGLAGAATKTLGAIKGGAAVGAGFGAAGAVEGGARNLGQVAEGAAGGALLGAAVPVAGRVLKYAAGRSNSKLLSIITGEGTDVIESALKNPTAADTAIANGDDALRTVVSNAGSKSIALRDGFQKAYRTGIDEIGKAVQAETGSPTITTRKDVQSNLVRALEGSKINVTKNGTLDFSQSQVQANPGEMTKIQQAYDAVRTWKDFSFAGTDELKHLFGKLTKFADEAGVPSKSPTLGRAYNGLNNLITDKVPKSLATEYSAANSKYSKTIDLYDDMVDAFNKGDPFSRVANLFSKNKDTLRQIVDFYDSNSGNPSVAGTVAGRELSAEKAASFGILNPRTWMDFIFSPKLQAQMITKLGHAENAVKGATKVGRTLTGAAEAGKAVGSRVLTGLESMAGGR
jgi:hypothetical protein